MPKRQSIIIKHPAYHYLLSINNLKLEIMKHEIGKNAGIIWQTIAARNGRITFEELLKETGLTESQVLLSIGWLEREDKVSIHGENGTIEAVTLYQERYF